jgi:hypothetical protein
VIRKRYCFRAVLQIDGNTFIEIAGEVSANSGRAAYYAVEMQARERTASIVHHKLWEISEDGKTLTEVSKDDLPANGKPRLIPTRKVDEYPAVEPAKKAAEEKKADDPPTIWAITPRTVIKALDMSPIRRALGWPKIEEAAV